MTGDEFCEARQSLCLTQAVLARLMGYSGQPRIAEIEAKATAPKQAAQLMQALLDGWRPSDWPK